MKPECVWETVQFAILSLMALLAEELVEEWLNRQGYFTIRGIKVGVSEMDILAIRVESGGVVCRHIEVQASINPVSYLFRLSKEDQLKTGRGATSAGRRTKEQLVTGANDWIEKKYFHPRLMKLKTRLVDAPWTQELVVHKLRHEIEREMLIERGVIVHDLGWIVREMQNEKFVVPRSAGADFVDLIELNVADLD
jgi:hypothetical protein